jgi:hydrogenase maturation protease
MSTPTSPDRTRTIVIGLGNPLMADDGLGLAVLEALRRAWALPPEVELVDGGTWGISLLPVIEDAKRVLLLDAIRLGSPPGALHLLEREQLPRYLSRQLSPHQVDLRDVLALAELRGTLPADTVAIGLEPARVEMSTELSDVLRVRLEEVVTAAVERLAAWGHEVSRIPEPTHA